MRNKSLIFAGKIKKEKIGKKMRISNCFGDPTGNGTFFIKISRTRINNHLVNVFSGITPPQVFS